MTIEFDGQNNKLGTTTANSVTIKTNDTDAITVDSSQNVGIGTSSPSSVLHIKNTTPKVIIEDGNNSTGGASYTPYIEFNAIGDNVGSVGFSTNGNYFDIKAENYNSAPIRLFTGGSEAMRIDSAGNVLVGTTTLFPTGGNNVEGITFQSSYESHFSRSSGAAIQVNRKTNDGDLVGFKKDGVAVGSIGNLGTGFYIASNAGSGLRMAGNVIPTDSNGNNNDNAVDLGVSTVRFDDVYATNGTIQTSDQNEKQSIQSLSASEIAVAQRISKLFKTFKFNSSVEEKGDSARTHTGIIAQDVQQAFTDEGLDASNYALFISSTWWEKEISVDAVAEELDEEGNIVVEGKDAYTYIDTKEEATEGYTERTRLGIRYPELLSFISSAFEQRLTNIETRLEALENI